MGAFGRALKIFSKQKPRSSSMEHVVQRVRRLENVLVERKEDMGIPDAGWSVVLGILDKHDPEGVWDAMTDKDLAQAFSNLSTVYACVSMISSTFTEARLEPGYWSEERNEPKWNPVPSHPVSRLLKRPSKDYDLNLTLQFMVRWLLTTGKSYSLKLRTKAGSLWDGALVPMSSDRFKPIGTTNLGGEAAMFAGFKFHEGNGNWSPLASEDVLYWYFPDPASPLDGVSPLEAARREYQLSMGRTDYMREWLENMKVPSLIVGIDKPLTPKQKQAWRGKIEDRVGKGKRGSEMVIAGKGKVSAELINPMKDIDMPGLSSLSESGICAAYNVPPIIVNVRAGLEHATYANYEHAKKSFYTETMNSLWSAAGSVLTRALMETEGEQDVVLRFVTDHLPAFQEDQDKLVERATKLFAEGVISRDEARAVSGFSRLSPELGQVFRSKNNEWYQSAGEEDYEDTEEEESTDGVEVEGTTGSLRTAEESGGTGQPQNTPESEEASAPAGASGAEPTSVGTEAQ